MKLINIIKNVAEGKIKGKEIKLRYGGGYYTYYVEEDKIINNANGTGLYIGNCLNEDFELIEEQQDIDIQAIKELDLYYISNRGDYKNYIDANFKLITDKYNELIKVVKQLDRREER